MKTAFDIDDELRALDLREDGRFRVLRRPIVRPNPSRPVLILVHAGDVLQDPIAWRGCPDYPEVRAYSLECQAGIASEIRARLNDHDLVVLHRGSCSQLTTGDAFWVDRDFSIAIYEMRERGAVLYGDDLNAASAWIVKRYRIADRPAVFLTGAYSAVDGGCVTAIGQAIEHSAPHVPITLSQYSPADNCRNGADRWIPGGSHVG